MPRIPPVTLRVRVCVLKSMHVIKRKQINALQVQALKAQWSVEYSAAELDGKAFLFYTIANKSPMKSCEIMNMHTSQWIHISIWHYLVIKKNVLRIKYIKSRCTSVG